LNNDKKAEPIPVVEAVSNSVEMSAEEYRAMIEMAKNAGPEDCEMCGS
jgi:ribonucleoside-diphosphate reductase alpha chain